MPKPTIIKAVVHAVCEEPDFQSKTLLDLSCGEGDVMAALKARGCSVEGTHYKAEDYILRNPRDVLQTVPLHLGVDLCRPLPFDDASYDVVLATEVIEHLPDHPTLIREASRILKPGGRLILTTPNIHRLKSRWTFFWTGRHDLLGGHLGWEKTPDELYSTHHHPVDFSILHTLLHHARLRIDRLGSTRVNPASFLLFLLYPLLRASVWFATRRGIRKHPEGGADLRRWLAHPHLLLSDQLMIVARKDA